MTRMILRALNAPALIFFVGVGIAIQSSLFQSWPLYYFQPDVVLLLVVWCALKRQFLEGGILTLMAANISEIHTSAPQGVHMISYMAVYLLIRLAFRYAMVPTLFSFSMLTLISSVLWKCIGLFVLYLLGIGSNQWRHTVTFLFFGAATEAVAALWVFRWMEKFDWITFKNARAEHAAELIVDEGLLFESEGF